MAGAIVLSLFVVASAAQDPPPDAAGAEAPPKAVAPYGEDVVEPFVPLHPRTAEDREELEALRRYVAARALEDRRQWRESITLLEESLKEFPDSVPILRRLGQLSFLLGRREEAAKYARRVLELEPGDTATIALLLDYYTRKDDAAGAEALLKSVAENPRLGRRSAGYLLIQRSLGELYATGLRDPQKAADAFARIVEALDEKSANQLSPGDQRRILGADEADAYARFGVVFLETQRHDLAIRAFERGLAYAPDHVELPRLLAQAYLRAGRPEEALEALEPFLKRQPQGREPYILLGEILDALKRSEEFLPRLEAAAKNDPKNAPLQYFLADRYREAGQRDKADALYKQLVATQPDPQGFGALAASLLRDKKFDELIKLFGEAFARPETLEAVKPQIEALANDPDAAAEVLDAALKLQQADPPRLSKESRDILGYIAAKAEKLDKLIPIKRDALRREPTPQGYRELWLDLFRAGQFAEAGATLEELLAKFPDEKDVPILTALSRSRFLAGSLEAALESADEAEKLGANDLDAVRDAIRLKGAILGRLGRNDDAIAFYRGLIERHGADEDMIKLAHSGLSIIYVNMDQLDKGEEELEILLERYPDDPGVNNDLGYLYADQGKDLEKAEQMIRKALNEEPENAAYLDSLGWVLFKQGKVKESLEPLEKAAKDGAADPTILDHLGDAHFKLMDLKKAEEAWRKAEQVAASANPPDRRLADIRKKLESLKRLDPALINPDAAPNP